MDNTIIFSDTSVFRKQVSHIAGRASKLVKNRFIILIYSKIAKSRFSESTLANDTTCQCTSRIVSNLKNENYFHTNMVIFTSYP